jgi:ketosteroid isomerase-like protein
MSNADRLLAGLAPIFGEAEREVDEALIDDLIAAIARVAAPRVTGSMTADDSFSTDFEDIDGLRDVWADWLGAFASIRIGIEEVQEIGDNVLTLVVQTGTTRHGVEVAQPSAAVWKFRDGLLTRVEFHLDREKALASAEEPV